MKTHLSLMLAAALVLSTAALAQNNPANGGASAGNAVGTPAASSLAVQSSGGNVENSDVWSVAEKLLNADSLGLDSENGIFQWNNSKFSVGDNLLVRSRFERYLSSPGFEQTDEYQQILQKIQDLLTTNTASTQDEAIRTVGDGSGDKIYQAWQLLYKAGKFAEDGGASQTLANQVFNAWRVRDELVVNKGHYNDLDVQRQQKEFGVATAGAQSAADSVTFARQNPGLTAASPSNSPGGGGSSSPNPYSNSTTTTGPAGPASTSYQATQPPTSGNNSGNNSGDLFKPLAQTSSSQLGGGGQGMPQTQAVPILQKASVSGLQSEELARIYARQNLLDADATAMGVEAKLQYQTQLFTYLAQRHFQHSLLAGMFYEHIFKGSQQRMNIAATEMSKFFNSDSVVPSVNNFEFISHEAINEVENGMKSVENAYERGDRWIALQQLQQTFLLGENLAPVQSFDPAKRRVLLSIYSESTALKHMMEIRDFAGAEEKLNKIEAEAKDFADADASPIISAIREGEQTSNNFVMAAEQAALSKDIDRVTANLQKATEVWPLNPEIASFSKTLRDHSNQSNVGGTKFDELLAKGDDRGIFDAKDQIGAAVFGDPTRSGKFKDIVNREMQVEMSISLANEALKQNNGYFAWETLLNATKIEPNDPVLALTKAQVAARVAPYVAALDAAERAEQAGDYPASLNYYLQAQDIYPASQICHDAVENLSQKIMAKLNPGGASAKALSSPNAAPVKGAPVGQNSAPAS